jgi:hypothetical protein
MQKQFLDREEEFTEREKQIVLKCAEICETLRFTEEGPSTEAKYQRVLCAKAIKDYFKLFGKKHEG